MFYYSLTFVSILLILFVINFTFIFFCLYVCINIRTVKIRSYYSVDNLEEIFGEAFANKWPYN